MSESTNDMSHSLLGDLRHLIGSVRERAAATLNSELVTLYWNIGGRIRTDLLQDTRAEYGKRVIAGLGIELSADYGRGFNSRNLHRMVRFAEVFPDEEIVTALRTQLSWTHLREFVAIDDPLKRQFYTELCRVERWTRSRISAEQLPQAAEESVTEEDGEQK